MPIRTLFGQLRTAALPLVVVWAGSTIPAAALAAGASIAGPSVVRQAQTAVFTGSGFAANAALSIAVTAPGGAESVFSAVSGADGTLRHTLSTGASGMHRLRVLDSAGRELAKLDFVAAE